MLVRCVGCNTSDGGFRAYLCLIWAGASELICPSFGYLGSPVNLTCIQPSIVTSHGYTGSQGDTAAACNVSRSSCTSLGDYRAFTINQTHSILTIPAAQPAHAGKWSCQGSSCNLTVVKEPSCLLTDAANNSSLCDRGDLAVHVIEYYCSDRVHLKLVPEGAELANDTVLKTKNVTVQITVTSTPSDLVFTCGEYILTIPCSCKTENVRTGRYEKGSGLNQRAIVIAGIFVSGFFTTLIILTCVIGLRRYLKSLSEKQCSNMTSAPAPPDDAADERSHVHGWGREGRGFGALDALATAMEQDQHAPATNMELSTFGRCSSDSALSDGDFDDDDDDDDDDGMKGF
ncbi:uncharacterized protein [Haliotis asinina]|uniref:uncharacterized protein n=1 Tax=Haliotis asinina TaxID=109174 RepID=UPI00353273E9